MGGMGEESFLGAFITSDMEVSPVEAHAFSLEIASLVHLTDDSESHDLLVEAEYNSPDRETTSAQRASVRFLPSGRVS
jgi:hypothetical protein